MKKKSKPRRKVGAPTKASGKTSVNNKKVEKKGIIPTGDRVLVRRVQPETKTAFGIIIPESSKEKSEEGIVVAVGPGKRTEDGTRIPVDIEVGQRVRFSYGDEMKINGVEHVLVHEDSITAIINN